MPLRAFAVMFDHNGCRDDIYVLYGTPESVERQVKETIADGERFPMEESPPEMLGAIIVNPTLEIATLLDKAYPGARKETEDNLFDVFTKLALGIDTLASKAEERREGHRQFWKHLGAHLQENTHRRYFGSLAGVASTG